MENECQNLLRVFNNHKAYRVILRKAIRGLSLPNGIPHRCQKHTLFLAPLLAPIQRTCTNQKKKNLWQRVIGQWWKVGLGGVVSAIQSRDFCLFYALLVAGTEQLNKYLLNEGKDGGQKLASAFCGVYVPYVELQPRMKVRRCQKNSMLHWLKGPEN